MLTRLSVGITKSCVAMEAFKGVQYAFLIGGFPRLKGMLRKDLIAKNTAIFSETGKAIDAVADKNIKVLVVANPANTNARVLMEHAPSIPRENFAAMTRLDANRARSLLRETASKKLGRDVPLTEVKNVIIWGNHSDTQFPDVNFATVEGKPAREVVNDDAYLDGEFLTTVQLRGKAVIAARGLSSACSAASTKSKRGRVRGCFGVNTVQQSSYGRMDVSKVSISLAMAMISRLSIPITGLNTGRSVTMSVQAMALTVWLATCPTLSPVISAPQSCFLAT